MPTKSVHYSSEWLPKQFGKAFRMILRPVKPCAPIKGIGWRKYNEYLIWKYSSLPIYTSQFPRPSTAANIAMFQVDFPTHIIMWPHRLVHFGEYRDTVADWDWQPQSSTTHYGRAADDYCHQLKSRGRPPRRECQDE